MGLGSWVLNKCQGRPSRAALVLYLRRIVNRVVIVVRLASLCCSCRGQAPSPKPSSLRQGCGGQASPKPAPQAEFRRGVDVASQLHVRRRDRCVPRGAEDRSVLRDGVLGRGDELQPAALVLRRGRQGQAALAKLGADAGGAHGEGEDAARAGIPARRRGAVRAGRQGRARGRAREGDGESRGRESCRR